MKTVLLPELQHEQNLDILFIELRKRREMMKTFPDSVLQDEISTIENLIYELRKHESKQVIVMRKDLNMRRGKQIAQGAHASMGVLLQMMNQEEFPPITRYTLNADGYLRDWLKGKFTKVAVGVNSELELLTVFENAKIVGLPSILITDSGLTEFSGIPTKTCCAIGPWRRDEIDQITGHLSLL